MESTIVIKVKYGETLRRFNACVVDEELELDMVGLREKVQCLFNFAPNAELTLTYIDEDGDVVTLVDDDDLRDVTRQSLNPLRVTARLNPEKSGRSYARSSGSSTPLRSPRVQNSLKNLNAGVSDILKSVPEPFHEALSKLSLDLASKAASTGPGFAEFLDSVSKMGLSYLNPSSDFHAGAESSPQTGALGSNMGGSGTRHAEGSKIDRATSEALTSSKLEVIAGKNNHELPNAESEEPTLKNGEVDLVNVTKGVEAAGNPAHGSMNLDVGLPGDGHLFECTSSNPAPGISNVTVGSSREVEVFGECNPNGNSNGFAFVNVPPVVGSVRAGDKNKEIKKSSVHHLGWKSVGVALDSLKHSSLDSKNTDLGSMKFGDYSGSRFSPINECPFTGMLVTNDSNVPPRYAPPVVPFKGSCNNSDGMANIFHRGVRCDGCGVHPITGPRFKSKVKENYDLCSICFREMGNKVEYIRMDRPATYRHHLSFKGLNDPKPHSLGHPPRLPYVLRGCGMKPSRPKLDSRFIQDVNVLDGTIMAPSTPFTKIWRMRNNGTIVWPQGTQLVWIGGDSLSDTLPVELEISAEGLPVDKELDIAVDFTAPALPGRYISYWRLALPSGQKFGQRVWVLIQVDASLKDSTFDGFHGLNLNLPPAGSGVTGPEVINENVEPIMEDALSEPYKSDRPADLVGPTIEDNPSKDQELNFPINDTLLVGGGVSSPVPSDASSTVPYPIRVSYPPILDFSEFGLAMPSPAPAPTLNLQASAQEVSEKSDVEQSLLRELEEMGFKQVDLNKEILRMNEYDLEQSVDDLCGVAEWDPILEELQEMGFCDNERNKWLLKKNKGSIKRVVMDLIAGEKA